MFSFAKGHVEEIDPEGGEDPTLSEFQDSRQSTDDPYGRDVNVYPFRNATVERWGPTNKEKTKYALGVLEKHEIKTNTNTAVYRKFNKALTKYRVRKAEALVCSEYEEVIKAAKEAGEMMTPDDHMMLAWTYVNLGILLSGKEANTEALDEKAKKMIVMRNDSRAVDLFREAAETYKTPPAKYLYGRALVYGLGGTDCKVAKGIKYLCEAGSQGIAEAYFELGSIYEKGIDNKIQQDTSLARDYYFACNAMLPYGKNRIWEADTRVVENLLRTASWHELLDIHMSVAGERFSWTIVGQSFLFGAASSLSKDVQPEHYSFLLVCIPVLGLIQGVFSLSLVRDYAIRSAHQIKPTHEMLWHKIEAYRSILDDSPGHSALQLFYERLSDLEKTIKWRKRWNACTVLMATVLCIVYVSIWALLIVLESISAIEGCGHWFSSTCMGSDAECTAKIEGNCSVE